MLLFVRNEEKEKVVEARSQPLYRPAPAAPRVAVRISAVARALDTAVFSVSAVDAASVSATHAVSASASNSLGTADNLDFLEAPLDEVEERISEEGCEMEECVVAKK
jgi:hypothetical protein